MQDNPETDRLLIIARTDNPNDGVKQIEVIGRAGLNNWYSENVGYSPDEDIDGLYPIHDLMLQVAEMLYLHSFGMDS